MSNHSEGRKTIFQNYINRFFIHPISKTILVPRAEAYVIIPCFAEEDLNSTLNSLFEATAPASQFCVIVVVNDKMSDLQGIKELTYQNLVECRNFSNQNLAFDFIYIDARNLDDKNAGVGLARKIGMDAVVFNCLNSGENPALICLDADCKVSKDYFQQIDTLFVQSKSEVAIFGFDHIPPPDLDPDLKQGIIQYELFLEYYRLGLKMAGFPFSFHTVGSSMACKAMPYARNGGMNQRKAGEDFYFLHKLFPHYETVEISGPLVFPASRVSKRVPFGTGRFQEKWLESKSETHFTYHPSVFDSLKDFQNCSLQFLEEQVSEFELAFSPFLNDNPLGENYLSEFKVKENLFTVLKSSPKTEQRKKAFFQWFDGLLALQMVHYFNRNLPQIPVFEAIKILHPQLEAIKNESEIKYELRKKFQASYEKTT